MDLSEVHILDIISQIIVVDLTSSPVNTFDLDNFVVCNGADCRNYTNKYISVYSTVSNRVQHTIWMPSILGPG